MGGFQDEGEPVFALNNKAVRSEGETPSLHDEAETQDRECEGVGETGRQTKTKSLSFVYN